jgi:serine/threonine protein kinase
MTKDYREIGMSDVKLRKASSTEVFQTDVNRQADKLIKGRYVVEKELGRGGVGIVYLARDRDLHDRQVVIKVLLDESSENAWYKKKFLQEAEALARLDHPCIVSVVDSGETPDRKPFLAMQYVKGVSLRSVIRYEGMRFEDVASIIRQMGMAITAAHEKDIYHCDLKPENIMLQDLGEGEVQVKVVDFGIAKIKNSQFAGSVATKVAGTLPYMSPEQIEGKPSASTDIFAMGVIAYEMLTGRRPFNTTAYNALEILRAGMRIKPRDLRPNLPQATQDLILKALSFNERDRHRRARDFGEMLAQTLTTDIELSSTVELSDSANLEMAHVLYTDIVGFSKLPSDQQTKFYKQLQQIVTTTETYQKAKASKQLDVQSTGSGMALIFYSGPKAPAQCAIEVARSVRLLPEIKLRMGINSGPVYRVRDANKMEDVAGAGIKMAHRIMDTGDAGHILLSKSATDMLNDVGDWRDHIHTLGEYRVKHGIPIHLYNMYINEVGNPRVPKKLRKKRTYSMAIAGSSVLLIAVITLVAWFLFVRLEATQVGDANEANSAVAKKTQSAMSRHSLIYSLTVQKFQGNRKDGPEFPLADSSIIFSPKYQIKVNVITPQPGYFYVLNEAAEGSPDTPIFIMLYPSDADKDKGTSTRIVIPEPVDEWIEFDNNRGTEKLWLVWSESAIPELELVRALANQERGEVRDQERAKAIQKMLARHLHSTAHKEVNNEAKHTTIKGIGSVIAYPLNMEHQP